MIICVLNQERNKRKREKNNNNIRSINLGVHMYALKVETPNSVPKAAQGEDPKPKPNKN